MSSLSATQADGYYAPPEYYDSGQYKKTSRNQLAGSKGHNQYLQRSVVRFELPYDGFCIECGAYVSKGTRFNAQKSNAGAYLTSPIYEFRMKCRICAAVEFVIRTNPKERGFDYVSGIHKQVQEFDTGAARTAGVMDTEDDNRLVGSAPRNSLAQAEAVADGKRKAETEREALDNLMKLNNKTFGQDVTCNSKIRSSFRKDRNEKKGRLKKGAKLGWGVGMELLDNDKLEDVVVAKSTTFSDGKKAERTKFRGLRTSSIFSRGAKRKPETNPRPDRAASQDLRTGAAGSNPNSALKQEPNPDTISSRDDAATIQPLPVKKKKKLLLATTGSAVSIVTERDDEPSSALDMLAGYGSDSD
jgi:coiled-coil domain-containing protein 130